MLIDLLCGLPDLVDYYQAIEFCFSRTFMLQTEVEAALEPNSVCVGDSFQCGNWDQAMVCVGVWVCLCVCAFDPRPLLFYFWRGVSSTDLI